MPTGTPSLLHVKEMFAQRGVDVSYETIRAWTVSFGPKITTNLRQRKLPPWPWWHLDEMVCRIGGESVFLWRAVNHEGEVMDMIVQKRRDKGAAVRFLRRLLKNQHVELGVVVTDGLRSNGAALQRLGLSDRHRPGRLRDSNRAENLHLRVRRRERRMQGFRSRASGQRFLDAHAAVYNPFNTQQYVLSGVALRVLRAHSESLWSRAVA